MTRQTSWKKSVPVLVTALFIGVSGRAAHGANDTASAVPPPQQTGYAIVGLVDSQSSPDSEFSAPAANSFDPASDGFPGVIFAQTFPNGIFGQDKAVGLNNQDEIVFSSGNVYRWANGRQIFEYRAGGGFIPSHLEYIQGKKHNVREGYVVPESYEPLYAADINNTGDVLGTSRYGLVVFQRGSSGSGALNLIVPNQNPGYLSTTKHGLFRGGFNNSHQIVGGLGIITAGENYESIEQTYLLWQNGMTSDLETRLNALEKGTKDLKISAAMLSPSRLQTYGAIGDYPVVGKMGFCPMDINDSGKIIGLVNDAHPKNGLKQITTDTLTTNPTPPTIPTTGGVSAVVPDTGISSEKPLTLNGFYHPAYWDGKLKILPIGPKAREGSALGINKQGDIVGCERGYLYTSTLEEDAVLWKGDTRYDLNLCLPPNSGWHLKYAYRINDKGEIIGEGEYQGTTASFLLIPVSQPQPPVSVTAQTPDAPQ